MTRDYLELIWLEESMKLMETAPGYHDAMTVEEAALAHGMTIKEGEAYLEMLVAKRSGRQM